MKIKYNTCNSWTSKQVDVLNKYDIFFNIGHDCKEIDEDKYFEIKHLLDEWNVYPIKYPEFERKEIVESSFSVISGYTPSGGYPMPDNLEYQVLTYNTDNWCQSCGTGLVQDSAFRLKKAPKLKKKVFGMYWVYDELFVEKEYYNELFKTLGIGCRDVMLYKGNKIIEDIVQLEIPTTEEELDLREYEYEICPKCNRKKYLPMPLGFFPIQKNPLQYIYKSKEYFGSGASANKKLFISKKLRNRLIKDKNMRWEWFIPCVEIGSVSE